MLPVNNRTMSKGTPNWKLTLFALYYLALLLSCFFLFLAWDYYNDNHEKVDLVNEFRIECERVDGEFYLGKDAQGKAWFDCYSKGTEESIL